MYLNQDIRKSAMHLHLFLFLYYRLVSLNPIIPFYSDTALLARILQIRTLSYLIMMCLVICAAITKKRPSKKGGGLVAKGFFNYIINSLFSKEKDPPQYTSHQFISLYLCFHSNFIWKFMYTYSRHLSFRMPCFLVVVSVPLPSCLFLTIFIPFCQI